MGDKNVRGKLRTSDPFVRRWSARANDTVLATFAGYDTRLPATSFSAFDTAAESSLAGLVRRVRVVAAVLGDILHTEYVAYRDEPLPNDYNVTVRGIPRNLSASDFQLDVSSAFVSELWSCFATDLACPYFTRYLNLGGLQSPRRPNYYPGVFGFLQIVSAEQTL